MEKSIFVDDPVKSPACTKIKAKKKTEFQNLTPIRPRNHCHHRQDLAVPEDLPAHLRPPAADPPFLGPGLLDPPPSLSSLDLRERPAVAEDPFLPRLLLLDP